MRNFSRIAGALLMLGLAAGLYPVVAQCRVDSLSAGFTLPGAAVAVAADNLGHIYAVTPAQTLEKYNRDGRLLSRYANNRLGRIAYIDVGNPLKVLVWYGDFRTAVFLDRSLTQLGELNLMTRDYGEVRAAAMASDGNLWIYDELAFKLQKISPAGEALYSSQELNLVFAQPVRITRLFETENALLALTPGHELLLFDFYAQHRGTQALEAGSTVFGARGNDVYYLTADAQTVVVQNIWTGLSRRCPVPPPRSEPGKWQFGPETAFWLRETAVEVFRY